MPESFCDAEKRGPVGFSLLEVLVVMGIVLSLTAVLLPVGRACLERARAAREISGARTAILAWREYTTENNGSVIPGYRQDSSAKNAAGQSLSFPANARYVFRLAPYLNFRIKGTLLVNDQEKISSDYEASMAPSFGINVTFVGGDFGSGSDKIPSDANFATYGKFVVTNINEIHAPASLLVFASARITDPALGVQDGYNAVKSPYFQGRRWASAYEEKNPYYDYGAVHPRFDGRAVCAMADGHVEMLSFDQLLDMRRWSNQAAQADDPDWTLQPL